MHILKDGKESVGEEVEHMEVMENPGDTVLQDAVHTK